MIKDPELKDEKKPEVKEEEEVLYQVVEIPTQHAPAIQTPAGEYISIDQAVVEILNELHKIRKVVG